MSKENSPTSEELKDMFGLSPQLNVKNREEADELAACMVDTYTNGIQSLVQINAYLAVGGRSDVSTLSVEEAGKVRDELLAQLKEARELIRSSLSDTYLLKFSK